jgi:SAM-dependent methyltransferase
MGRCNACGRPTFFVCADPATARGNMFCLRCRSFSRKRHVIANLLAELGGVQSLLGARPLCKDVYSATTHDVLWRHLGGDPRFAGSELMESVPLGGALPSGGTCQNLERLTFADNSFDVVITEDVLEHVRYPDKAFAEIARILRPGGLHIFTVPLVFDRPTVERVQPRDDGDDVLLTPPEWHGDRVHGRSLAYRTFGLDIFEWMARYGFETSLDMALLPDRRAGIVDSYVLRARLAAHAANAAETPRDI